MLLVEGLVFEGFDVVAGLEVYVGEEDDVEGGLAEFPFGYGLVPEGVGAGGDGQVQGAERGFVLVGEEFFECVEHGGAFYFGWGVKG